MHRVAVLIAVLSASVVLAGPAIQPGDLALRHDIQRLADHGVITGPVSTWPLAWGPVLDDVRHYESAEGIPRDVADALARVRSRGEWATRTDEMRFRVRAALQEKPVRIRAFQDTPREEAELSGGVAWTGERFSIDLNATAVSSPLDDKDLRADGSQIAVAIGNLTIAASTLDRWWGPAWDSSLILSSNARPIPAITIDRRFTDPFQSKWLSWLGPWDASFIWGQLEKERAVPNTRFLGFRLNFRPFRSLEIGISRTAQWCGDGRPCSASTFWDLLIGQDNVGSDDITRDNEPGNQTAAIDFRWSVASFGPPMALYGQFMAEDEAGGLPSRYMGQLGAEGTGILGDRWLLRWYIEASSTSCDFASSEELFNCAYNHGIYESGYRYHGRVIGHGADNDARVASLGLMLVDANENSWQGTIRSGELNRGGPPDPANSLTPLPQDIFNVELIHNRIFGFGRLEFGVGYERFGKNSALPSSNAARAFIQWRSDY